MALFAFFGLFYQGIYCSANFSDTNAYSNCTIIDNPEMELNRALVQEYVDADLAAMKHKVAKFKESFDKCQNPTLDLNTEFGQEIINRYEKYADVISKEILGKIFNSEYDYQNFPLLQNLIQIFCLDKELVLLYSKEVICATILKVLGAPETDIFAAIEDLDSLINNFDYLNLESDKPNIFMKLIHRIHFDYSTECEKNNITRFEIAKLMQYLTMNHSNLKANYNRLKHLSTMLEINLRMNLGPSN